MATNLNIDMELLNEAQLLGGFKTKRETVNQALQEFIRFRLRQDLLLLENSIDYYPDFDHKSARNKR